MSKHNSNEKHVCSICKDTIVFTDTPNGLQAEHSCLMVDWWGRDNGSFGLPFERRDEHPEWEA